MGTRSVSTVIDWHENLRRSDMLKADEFADTNRLAQVCADGHLHAFTTAFGLPGKRLAARCRSAPLQASFDITEITNSPECRSSFFLKLTAMLQDWRKQAMPVQLRVNGETRFSGPLFFENVCKGWPSNYFELPPEILRPAANTIELINTSRGADQENTLWIHSLT